MRFSFKWLSASLLLLLPFIYYGHFADFLYFYNIPLGTWSYIAVICSSCFVIYQARIFIIDYRNRKSRAENEVSYRMAQYYSKNILPNIPIIISFLAPLNKKIDPEYLDKRNLFIAFTKAEADSIFYKGAIDKFNFICFNNIAPKEILIRYEMLKTNKTSFEIKKEWENIISQNSKSKKGPDVETQFYLEKTRALFSMITFTLNDLEYIAMHFRSRLAIPAVVFVSLHQTYLDLVRVCYLFICLSNNRPNHEYYTHVRDLFIQWQKESNKKDASTDASK